MYQRLGLEANIVDPSNTLLREGPVLKISFRRSDPIERYLFLVGAAGRPQRREARTLAGVPGGAVNVARGEGDPWRAAQPGKPLGHCPGCRPHSRSCPLQFNNMLLYCVPRVIQMGARFQVRTRIDVAGMKVRPPPPPPRAPLGFIQGRLKGGQ